MQAGCMEICQYCGNNPERFEQVVSEILAHRKQKMTLYAIGNKYGLSAQAVSMLITNKVVKNSGGPLLKPTGRDHGRRFSKSYARKRKR
jgi:hypothetical protein